MWWKALQMKKHLTIPLSKLSRVALYADLAVTWKGGRDRGHYSRNICRLQFLPRPHQI